MPETNEEFHERVHTILERMEELVTEVRSIRKEFLSGLSLSEKPNWEDAPEWAQYLAQDEWGAWYWYENLPFEDDDDGEWTAVSGRTRFVKQGYSNPDWEKTLEERPRDNEVR